jgi:hypothetical protein
MKPTQKQAPRAEQPSEQVRPFIRITNYLIEHEWQEHWSAQSDLGETHSDITAWVKNGRVILVQRHPLDSVEIYYPSPSMRLDALEEELALYASHEWLKEAP